MRFAVILIFFGAIITLVGYVLVLVVQPKSSTISQDTVEMVVNETTASAKTQEVEKKSVNLDGTKSVTMKAVANDENTTYTFINSDNVTVLEKTVPNSTTLDLSINSYSPDDKYIFIKEIKNGLENALIIRADGEAFANEEKVIDVGKLFSEKVEGLIFDKATGWAAPTLLVVKTKNINNEKGPNYWFDLSFMGFLRLAS